MKKLRELKKDIARIKTVAREREPGHAEQAEAARGRGEAAAAPRAPQADRKKAKQATKSWQTTTRPPAARSEHERRSDEQPRAATRRSGNVVSTKMQKTIVVEVEMRKAHPKYKRVMKLEQEVLCA